ncbi:S26 family signal peptidase [Ochrobactrum pecoris]|uniref:Conjugative transfer signal peptidase TraF n=1 Tax=Brucella pecoris TaxID=867683 RepID=A0A5C5CBC1_9HYPH|nr:S26 family signal peptidase [Brucella pecoris]MBB4096305.1 conjugative transfer signal peptidase TraF [Brucella pecoris]NKW82567.1 S26 family signal peptidase [Brucella pecoris]TNV08669.1 S26 family signal peptidase [Brucella pecoris]
MTARRLTILSMLAGTALIALPAWNPPDIRFIWNASASVPVGLYRIVPLYVSEGDQLDVTDLAVVVPPDDLATLLDERGYLPKGVPLLKRVLALGGTEVCRVASTIIAYDMSYGRALERDSQGRSLPTWQGCRILADSEAFFMNWDSPDSFDSRYFGPLPITTVIGRAIPIWTTDYLNPRTDNDNNPALNAP